MSNILIAAHNHNNWLLDVSVEISRHSPGHGAFMPLTTKSCATFGVWSLGAKGLGLKFHHPQ